MKRAAVVLFAALTVCYGAHADTGQAAQTVSYAEDLVRFGMQDLAHGLSTSAYYYFDEAARLDSTLTDAWTGQARALDQLQRYGDALHAADHALRLKPDDAAALAVKGRILFHQRKYNDALQSLDRSLSFSTADTAVYRWQGETLDSLGRHAEAAAAFDKASPPAPPYKGGVTRVTKTSPYLEKIIQQQESEPVPTTPAASQGSYGAPGNYRVETEEMEVQVPELTDNYWYLPGYYGYGLNFFHRHHRPGRRDFDNDRPRFVAPYRGVVPPYQQPAVPPFSSNPGRGFGGRHHGGHFGGRH